MAVDQWRPTRRPVPVHSDRGDDVVLVPENQAADVVVLNPTAMALLELCDGNTSVDEMVVAVCALFAIDPVQARIDVESTLLELRATGLVT